MSDMNAHIGKHYVDDREELVDSTVPDGNQTDKNSVVRHSELPENTRVLGPNSMATMDYNEDRWNLHVDEENVVKKVVKG